MILSLMTFLAIVSVPGMLGAMLAEAGLRRIHTPIRWAWLAGMALGPVLLIVGQFVARSGLRGLGGGTAGFPTIELSPLLLGSANHGTEGALAWLAPALLWLTASAAMGILLIRAYRALLRERARWQKARILGRDVYVSPDRGPAIAGVVRPWIILPRWALKLDEPELEMVLLHEEEHVRAGDSALLALALALVALTAWNPITWWQLRRLRLAVEMDCDRRVLRQVPDRRTYGQSLLTVAGRAARPSLGWAAFAESSWSLQQRILAMTATSSRWTGLSGVLLITLGVVVGGQACGVENPAGNEYVPLEETSAQVEHKIQEATSEEPTFTPFTAAPSILNRQEVIEAMEGQYPPLLREAGIGGTVRVYFFIDPEGVVQDARIEESSGQTALDDAAIRVARVFQFSPALNEDKTVPVWVSFPITFQTR
jgi:TonB family protein